MLVEERLNATTKLKGEIEMTNDEVTTSTYYAKGYKDGIEDTLGITMLYVNATDKDLDEISDKIRILHEGINFIEKGESDEQR